MGRGAEAKPTMGRSAPHRSWWYSLRSTRLQSTVIHDTLRRLRSGCEQPHQGALDRGVATRREDLRTEEIGDVEHVDGALAERRHMGGGDVEIELGQRGGQVVE